MQNRTDPNVSVIVPVYNGEKHLRQCMDSICGQTLQEIEILCVDDGSTDSSWEILKEYRERDDRVQLYQQANRYAGAARNMGKKHATGEYLAFWDCDDFFEPEALEELYGRAQECEADVVVCGGNRYFENRGKLQPMFSGFLNPKLLPEEAVFSRATFEEGILNYTNAAAWNKLFRREFIEQIDLDFQEIRNGNDVYFTVAAICQAERVTTVNKALINYRMNQSESLVGTLAQSPLSPIHSWVDLARHLREVGAFPERSFANKAIGSMIYLLRNIREYGAFSKAVNCLQEGALQEMHIVGGRPEEYYYNPWYRDFVEHILSDTPEEVQTFLAYYSYSELLERSMEKSVMSYQLKEVRAQNKKQKQKIKELKETHQKEIHDITNSVSFKLGRAITWLPRKIRDFIHRDKGKGKNA